MRVSKWFQNLIFGWTQPSKWNIPSICAHMCLYFNPHSTVRRDTWFTESWPVHQDVPALRTRESKIHCGLSLIVSVSLGMSQQCCPCPTAQGPVTEPGRREWVHFVATQQAWAVPILLPKLSCITTLLWPKLELKAKNRAREWKMRGSERNLLWKRNWKRADQSSGFTNLHFSVD